MGLNIRLQSRYRLHQLLDRVWFHGGLQRRRLWFFSIFGKSISCSCSMGGRTVEFCPKAYLTQ